MLVIDTNILYYAFGLSQHHAVESSSIRRIINAEDKVVISSVSLAEFLMKYHNHARTVRRVCSFMHQNHIGLTSNHYIPFKDDIIKKLTIIRQNELNDIHKNLIVLKAKVESSFATVIFFAVLISETIFECKIDPYCVPDCIYDFFKKVFKISLQPIITDFFMDSYMNAYKTDDAENKVREDFYNYLKMCISLCIPLCKHVIEEYNNIPEGELVDIPSIIKQYDNDYWAYAMTSMQKRIDKQPTPAQFVKNQGLAYGKSISDKHLSSLLAGLDTSYKKTIGVPSIEEYLFSITSNTIRNGGAFRKNDINDALILSSLTASDTILTFDRRMLEHISAHSSTRIEYRNSISLIKSIWPST